MSTVIIIIIIINFNNCITLIITIKLYKNALFSHFSTSIQTNSFVLCKLVLAHVPFKATKQSCYMYHHRTVETDRRFDEI